MPEAPRRACPICGKSAAEAVLPFCSRRCADVDLNRWLSGVYAVPVTEDEEEDERRDDSGEGPRINTIPKSGEAGFEKDHAPTQNLSLTPHSGQPEIEQL